MKTFSNVTYCANDKWALLDLGSFFFKISKQI